MFNKSSTKTPPAKSTPAPSSMEPSVMKKPTTPAPRTSNSAPSILGRDIVITGDIKTDGEVQIDGRLDGNVIAAIVTIGESGAVNGTIKADRVLIRGKVQGKVTAMSVELAETANVAADLTQDELSIANGAFFDGKCARKSKSSVPLNAPEAKNA